jgi:hypothetical protein
MSPLKLTQYQLIDQKFHSTTTKQENEESPGGRPTPEIVHTRPIGDDLFDADVSPIALEPDPSFDDTNHQIGAMSHRSVKLEQNKHFDHSHSADSHEREDHPREVSINQSSLLEQDASMEGRKKDQRLDLSSQMTSPFKDAGHPQLTPRTGTFTCGDTGRPFQTGRYSYQQQVATSTPNQPNFRSSVDPYHGRQYESFHPTNAQSSTSQLDFPPQHAQIAHGQYPLQFPYRAQSQSPYYSQYNHQKYHHGPLYQGTGTATTAPNHPAFGAHYHSNPLSILFSVKVAFEGCTYRLSCLRDTRRDRIAGGKIPTGVLDYESQVVSFHEHLLRLCLALSTLFLLQLIHLSKFHFSGWDSS